MVLLEFFISIILPSHDGFGVELASNRNEYQEYVMGVKTVGVSNFIIFMSPLPLNLRALYSWKPQGLSRPVIILLYLYRYTEQ